MLGKRRSTLSVHVNDQYCPGFVFYTMVGNLSNKERALFLKSFLVMDASGP